MSKFTTEDDIEAYNLELLDALGYGYKNGYNLEPEGAAPERQSFGDVLLKDRLTQALARINPHIPPDIRQQAQRELQNIASPDLIRDLRENKIPARSSTSTKNPKTDWYIIKPQFP